MPSNWPTVGDNSDRLAKAATFAAHNSVTGYQALCTDFDLLLHRRGFLGVKDEPGDLLQLGRTMKDACGRHFDPGEALQQVGEKQPGLERCLPLRIRPR